MAKELSVRYTLNGHTAMAHRTKLDWCREICVSEMPDELVTSLGMIPAGSIREAWEKALRYLPTDWKGYVIPNGFVDIPFLGVNL